MEFPLEAEADNPPPQASSSKVQITNDGKNPLADFAFDKLPTELLVEVFKHSRPDNIRSAFTRKYPVTLAQVCQHWRRVALNAPALWANIYIVDYYAEETKAVVHMSLEYSKTCPLFLTWLSKPGETDADAKEVINDLIIPHAERWQRITLLADNEAVPDALLIRMRLHEFPILRDLEVTSSPRQFSQEFPLYLSAPLLHRCRLRKIPFLPPLPSNLVVLDYMFAMPPATPFNLDPLLEFLSCVTHSLEHLRFGPPFEVLVTPRKSRILLQNLKSLLVRCSYDIMEHILVPNLVYFAASSPFKVDGKKVAQVFQGFSAPNLQSIWFHGIPLLSLASHNLHSAFPQLESLVLDNCIDEPIFATLLEPPQSGGPSPSQEKSGCREMEIPFPKLRELAISDRANWTSFQVAIEKRLKNGGRSLKKIWLPKEDITDSITRHLTQWLPKQGIELILYELGDLPTSTPSVFQDDFCNEESDYLSEIVEEDGWYEEEADDDGDEDYDFEYWEEELTGRPDYGVPFAHDYFDEFHDEFDDEEGYGYEGDDFYEG